MEFRLVLFRSEQLALIREEVAEKEGYQPIQIAQDLDWNQFAAINVRLTELAGVQPIRGYARVYPTGPAVAHLLGYVERSRKVAGQLNAGVTGLMKKNK